MDPETTFELNLEDPEENITYKLILSEEDYSRAQIDHVFITKLLNHAKSRECESEFDGPGYSNAVPSELLSEPQTMPEALNKRVDSSRTISIWSHDKTKALIGSMQVHYADLSHPLKRKHVYENVANDLISRGYTTDSITCQNKWKSLVRSYGKAKDAKTRTGQGPPRFQFLDLMDVFLGEKPTNSCAHSLNTLPQQLEGNDKSVEDHNNDVQESEVDKDVTSDVTDASMWKTPNKKGKLNQSERKLKQRYIEMKLEEYANRKRRHKDKVEIENRKIDIENKRLKLLEEYLKNKASDK